MVKCVTPMYNQIMIETEVTPEHGKKPGWLFYYDGDCGFCTRVVEGLTWLDFSKGVRWVPFQSLADPPGELEWDDLQTAAYLDCGQDTLEEGFYAFRKLTIKIVPLMPLAPLFWFPGMHLLGVPVYRWVARNRYRISRCKLPSIKSNKAPGPGGN